MKILGESFKKIYHTERGILVLMIFNFLLSLGLFIFSIVKLNPNAPVVKIGYGDIGGYRDGAWTEMLVFPLFAFLFGILHNILALRIFQKRGSGMTKFFVLITTVLILGTFFILLRLIKES